MTKFSADERIDAMMEAQRRTLYFLREELESKGIHLEASLEWFFDDQYKAELGMIAERKKT